MIKSVAAALACGVCIVAIATPAQAQMREYRVPAGSLKAALDTYARQSGRQVIYKVDEVRRARSPGASGNISAEAALDSILSGTGFTARRDNSGALAIVQTNIAGSPSVGKTPAPGEAQAVPSSREAPRPAEGAQAGIPDEQSSGEIVVTGSRIPGAVPASPVTIITREDIDRTGYSTTAEVIRTLPQNFNGGQSETVVGAAGDKNTGNAGYSSGVNLRGLGSEATLVLVNGHRLAPSGFQNSVDISVIPLSAVQRIEVLTDGASAIYGSDAVSGVINFILRRKYDGAETIAEGGFSADGGGSIKRFAQSFGRSWSSGGIVLNYEHFDQDALNASQREFSENVTKPYTLTPAIVRNSLFASINQDLGDNVRISVDAVRAWRSTNAKQSAATFQSDFSVRTRQYSVNPRVEFDISNDWTTSISASLAGDRFNADQAFTSGTFNRVFMSGFKNSLREIEAAAAGSLFSLPAGSVKLAFGGGYRTEKQLTVHTGITRSRDIKHVYGELRVPLIGSANEINLIKELSFSAALRLERYSDFGSATSPKIGIVYKPADDIELKGTWGRSFRAPSFSQFFTTEQILQIVSPNAASPTGRTLTLVRLGGNPILGPERSVAKTFTASYTPHQVRSLRFTTTYFSINYEDRIAAPLSLLNAAYSSPAFAVLITSPVTAAQVEAAVANAATFSNFSGIPFDPARIEAIVDARFRNIGSFREDGLDLAVGYQFDIQSSKVQLNASATRIFNLNQRITPEAGTAALVGTAFNSPKLRVRGGAGIQRGWFQGSLFLNYQSGSLNNISVPQQRVDSWFTIDGQVGAEVGEGRRYLSGLAVALSVRNIFNQDPPFVGPGTSIQPFGYDSTNASPLGRFISLRLSKKW